MNPFFISTPIYYVNGKPSIGHAYTTIAADVLARYQRRVGRDVFFLTGTDENSQKNVEAAEAAGRGNDIDGYISDMAAVWKQTWDDLHISYDRFIRTTEPDHLAAVEAFWHRVQASGDIYKGAYEGLYCKGCEAFVTEAELANGLCPIHKTAPETIKESNYFFKLTRYKDALLAHIKSHPEFVSPAARRNEVTSYIEKFMTDVSISRSTMNWGIPVPGDESQRIYVWFDALINYISGIGFGTDEAAFARRWNQDATMINLVGKDIIKFHCAIWPAMLLSAGLPLPTRVFAHGFFTVDGDKMSKSLGNVIDPLEIAHEWGEDVLRYYLLRDIRFGEDGDFSHERLAQRYASDLANDLGNLTHRVLTMADKYGAPPLKRAPSDATATYHAAMESLALHEALEEIWRMVREANQRIEQEKPWEMAKAGKQDGLTALLEGLLRDLGVIAYMLEPFMPETSSALTQKLSTGKKGDPLFPRRDL